MLWMHACPAYRRPRSDQKAAEAAHDGELRRWRRRRGRDPARGDRCRRRSPLRRHEQPKRAAHWSRPLRKAWHRGPRGSAQACGDHGSQVRDHSRSQGQPEAAALWLQQQRKVALGNRSLGSHRDDCCPRQDSRSQSRRFDS
eukprot:Amastigsp_a841972_24.p5 type:complete len:142 gc:universal Amastigsp_a841972_24:1051-1476(+)